MQILIIYFIFNIFLFVMAGFIFIKTTPDLMVKRLYNSFKIFICAFGAYLIANSLWTMQEMDIINLPKWAFNIVIFASLSTLMLNTFCFYKFTMIYFGYSGKTGSRVYEICSAIPFILIISLLFSSMFNGLVFSISDDVKIVKGNLYFAMMGIAFFYFLIILVSSFIEMIRTKRLIAKKNCITIFALVIFLVFWVLIDDRIDGLTIIPMAIFSIILVLFISFQDASINTDSLTQMNNRRRAFEYLSSQISDLSPDRPMYLYICDINSFKDINDRYGHIEGDQALVILANAIKEVVTEINGFAARYGGDEFIIAIRNKDENYDPNTLVKKIENLVDLKRRTQDKKYLISIAAGCVKCDSNKLTLENYIKEADNLLYIYKNDLKKREK